ncbi:hypothetical protein A0J47_020235 (plasmid) [Photobacterium damselae subsp. damselae]|uniref:Uncharacterized protein n=1 Tax=Photobacterium damselae subsp. damselae TaxID=85581 RepID=E4WLC4_PHODD|nr:hypothetical protein [Photobacterium damselae]QSH59602.1 hypothetical protein A0J47_020235 [Photobacterium damselae subsp. damselae]CBX86842.1 hypothetical protein [Photobacterium damselae subsp. damselae]
MEIFADYNQVYLHDETIEPDLSVAWDDQAYEKLIIVDNGYIALSTARNMDVPVEIVVSDEKPDIDKKSWEHIVYCSITLASGFWLLASGFLVVRGPSDYLPDATRVKLKPGNYAAYVLYKGLTTLSEDGLEGDDYYNIILWPSDDAVDVTVLKNSGFNC